MECIICRDLGKEPIIDNTSCACKYKRHISCWINYIHSTPVLKCPICRKELQTKKPTIATPLRQSYQIPYTPRLESIPEEHEIRLTYNEFNEEVRLRTNSYQASNINQTHTAPLQQPKLSFAEKALKLTFGLCLIALVITVIILLV